MSVNEFLFLGEFVFGSGKSINDIRIIDIHSHILPGVDDGAKDAKTATAMAKMAVENNITDIIVTPHYKVNVPHANKTQLMELMVAFQKYFNANGIKLKLHMGNEIMRCQKVAEGNLTSVYDMNNSGYYLIEFHPSDSFSMIHRYLSDLTRFGISPIIAHIERYDDIDDLDKVKRLKNLGVLIQTNYTCVMKIMDKHRTKFIHKLLKEELIDFVASDSHSTRTRNNAMLECAEFLYKKFDNDYVDRILYKNAIDYLKVDSYE